MKTVLVLGMLTHIQNNRTISFKNIKVKKDLKKKTGNVSD